MPERTCSIDGCCDKHYATGLCKRHYRQRPDQAAKASEYRAAPSVRERRRQSDRKRRAKRQAYITEWGRRQAMPRWAAWWEDRRRAEDVAELAQVVNGRGAQGVSSRPRARQFVAGSCPGCGESVVVIRGWWHDSIYCPSCTKLKWRMNHRQRARHYGVAYEYINPHEVFAADGHRCCICRRKTRGRYPHPRSPTIDHIVPMSSGGPHLKHNVQTACLGCNVSKGGRSANDQLRLELAA
jgi:hypothetical protein